MKLRKLLLHHAAYEDYRQHPLPRFVGGQHVDHVAAPVAEAQRFEPHHAFTARQKGSSGSVAVLRDEGARLRPALRRRGRAPPPGCATSSASWRSVRRTVGGGRKRLRRCEARRPIARRKRERSPLLDRAQDVDLCISRSAPSQRLAFGARSAALSAQSARGNLLADGEIESVHGARIGKRGARRRTARVAQWSHPPSMASTAPQR